METEILNTEFPNKKLLKGRDAYQNLSNISSTGTGTIICGILGTLVFSGILFGLLTGKMPARYDTIFIPVLLVCLIILCLTLIYYAAKNKINIESSLLYDSGKIIQKRIINLIVGIIFMIGFLSIFFWVYFKAGASIMFAIIAGIIAVVITLGSGLEAYKIYNLILENKRFKSTELKIINSSPIHLGNQLQIELHNKFISKHLDHVDVMLRNIQECWEKDKRKNKQRHNTYLLYENVKKIRISETPLSVTFNLPINHVAPTDYTTTEPFYWELEISNKEENYFCIFYIEIKP